MNSEKVEVSGNDSAHHDASGLVLTVRKLYGDKCDLVVGFPGLPNATRKAATGDALLYETPNAGTFEIRILTQSFGTATLLVTHVAPRPGLSAAFVTSDPQNTPFGAEELEKISSSINAVKNDLQRQAELLPEQVDIISRKLDEIQDASKRLGRKDWINYTAGAITSICVSAAFSPAATKAIFISLNTAFSWLFGNVLQLLP